jgi:hypothetical protein
MKGASMLKLIGIFCLLVTAFPAVCQSTSQWQRGTITEVKVHQVAEKVGSSEAATYDVSLKVGDTIYVVLYTPPLREETVKYAAGRDLLVFVDKGTIRYNDILGRLYEAPIESRRPATNSKGTEPVSRAAQ